MRKILREDLLWSAVLMASLFLLSFKFLTLWFILDDSANIYASLQNPLKLIFDRDTYLFFNKMFYTPLLPISFKPDFLLFGFRPLAYHMHNFFVAFLTGLMGYKIYRLYLPRFESWAGTFLFMLSFPIVNDIGWLSMRHYLWGSFFALASFYLFKRSETESRIGVLSWLLYLISLLFKESFAPFPAIVFLLAKGNLREKAIKSMPFFLALGCYLVLRHYIIGGLGGYPGGLPDPHPASLIKNYVSQLSMVSKAVWGLPLYVSAPVLLLVLLSDKRVAAVCIGLLALTTAPFMFLKVSGVLDDYSTFYFPSKYILPLYIFSGATASALAYAPRKHLKFLSAALLCLLFVLQLVHAGASHGFIKRSAESYRELASGGLDRNIQGKDLLIVSQDAMFYNFLYATYTDSTKPSETNLGTVITIDNPDLCGLLGGRLNGKHDSVYRNEKWSDQDGEISSTPLRIDNTVPKPTVSMDMKGQFLSFSVTDRKNGSFYAALKSAFSPRNIAIQSMLLPKHVPMKLGLARSRDMLYLFYCDGGRCSEPIVISPGGG